MYNFDTFCIVPLEHKDAASLNRLIRSNWDYFGKYLPVTISQNKTISSSEEYIEKKAKENKNKIAFTFAIKELATNEIAGLIILKNIDTTKKQAEFAYGLGQAFAGKGWTTKAVIKMSEYALETMDIKTLQIITHKTNIASCKVAEKSGFLWKQTLKNEFTPPNGAPQDMELYELAL